MKQLSQVPILFLLFLGWFGEEFLEQTSGIAESVVRNETEKLQYGARHWISF